jgi:hypothetical protein
MPKPWQEKIRKAKDDLETDAKIHFKLIKMTSGGRNHHGVSLDGKSRGVKVDVQLLPETRLLLALANEEVRLVASRSVRSEDLARLPVSWLSVKWRSDVLR